MKIIDEECLSRFRAAGTCELCRRHGYPLDPHHAFVKRGMGGGSRLDVPINLAALCRVCHRKAEDSQQVAEEVQRIVAAREKTTAKRILARLHRMLRR